MITFSRCSDGYWTNWTYKDSVNWTIGLNNFISPVKVNFIGLISIAIIVQVEVYKNENDNDNKKFFEIFGKKISLKQLKLWQGDVDDSKLNHNYTEEDIGDLGDGYKPKEEDNISIVAVTTDKSSRERDLQQKKKSAIRNENIDMMIVEEKADQADGKNLAEEMEDKSSFIIDHAPQSHVLTSAYQSESTAKEQPKKAIFEFYRVNDSCSKRLGEEKIEDSDPNENNKRKKNREDTLYRTKFGTKSIKENEE
ncbi:hypothetical protein GLOIN_2v1477168 [Rhizophagus clarus]|uniref:Uncharacterized protein n=1 Tax=Rhizophagus clarus TaxID=94130 RepID=A0A8H3LTT2_9GLOM|nr:hypothetical protein GLOIN_2v1477168 [Rhizophagus clarus]